METQKIVNLLNGSDNESSKFATKNGTLLMTKTMDNKAKEVKMIHLLNLKQAQNCMFPLSLYQLKVNLAKQLNEGFKRSVYRNEYE